MAAALRVQMRAMALFWDGRYPCIIDSECCVLAASRVMGDGDDDKVSDLVFSCGKAANPRLL